MQNVLLWMKYLLWKEIFVLCYIFFDQLLSLCKHLADVELYYSLLTFST